MTSDLRESTRARASLELLYDISRELAAHLNLDDLLARILELTIETTGGQSGSIIVIDEYGKIKEGAFAFEGKIYDQKAAQLSDTFDQGLAGWVVRNQEPVLVENTLLEDRWLKRELEVSKGAGKSAILVPLTERERVVGVLTIVHPEEGHFHDKDLDLLNAIADQAGLAIENAQLFSTEQSRRKFASTLQEIARSINSSLDPSQVFPLILDQLSRVIEFDSASIFVHGDDMLRLVAAHGIDEKVVQIGLTIPTDGNSLIGQVLMRRRPLAIDDIQVIAEWNRSEEMPQSAKMRSWIGAPLLVRDKVVGVLTVDNKKAFAYGPLQLEMVDAFANQAATAIANAEIYAESQRQMQATVALAETARVVSGSLNLDEVLGRILEQTMKTLDVEATSIALLDKTNNELEFKSALGNESETVVGIRLQKGEGIAGWVAENGEALIVPDVNLDPRFNREIDQRTGFETRAIACVPIRVQDEILGVLEVLNPRRGTFENQFLEILLGIAGMAGTAIEHARLYSETQAARQRYAGLFEDSIDPILLTDLEGIITDANRRAHTYLGRSAHELQGRQFNDLHDAPQGSEIADLHQLEIGVAQSFASTALHMDGSTMPVEIHVKRMDMDGLPILQWILRDLSERHALDQLKADLTSMIFHDLRSPLGNIISSLEVMKISIDKEDETMGAVISVAQRSSRRLLRLIDSLLDIGLLEEGRAELYKSAASISSLVDEAMEEVRPVAEAKGQDLTLTTSGTAVNNLEIDVDMIRRVVINLVENAVKYTPANGVIRVHIEKGEHEILVRVKDNGQGIEAENQKIIFDKFARLTRKGRSKGLGLGLAFCRLGIEAHGGKVWVESEPGQGATFFFTLPV
ncbi:MAG: GAF domain-containing protein [Chloroflexi bacterium]|nr:GAF domain-containing protein [Chloroflexota bacterium]